MSTTSKKQLSIDGEALARYPRPAFQFIPLHPFGATLRKKSKKTGTITIVKIGKRPRDAHWPTNSYDSETQMRAAIKTGYNIGVRLKRTQLVIDIDPRNGGVASFRRLCEKFGLDPTKWPHVITGSGGSHYYLSLPAGVKIVAKLDGLSGVEFKTFGTQVVAAGSIHPESLAHYKWDEDAPPLTATPPDCPDALLQAISKPDVNADDIEEAGTYTPQQIADGLDSIPVGAFHKNHDEWLALMFSCHAASNGEARDEFIAWCVQDAEYADEAEAMAGRWDSCSTDKPGGIKFGTFNHYVKKYGDASKQIRPPSSAVRKDFGLVAKPLEGEILTTDGRVLPPPSDDDDSWMEGGQSKGQGEPGTQLVPLAALVKRGSFNTNKAGDKIDDTYFNALMAIDRSGLEASFNELSQQVHFKNLPWQIEHGEVLTDDTLRIVRVFVMNKHKNFLFEPSLENMREAIRTVSLGRLYNPVLQYLNGLKWDGVPRVELLFGQYFNCRVDDYTRGVSTAFMVGAVRRMRLPGIKFDTMPVVRGPQGWNKSTAFKVLFGAQWFSDSELGDIRSKDAAMMLRGIWFQEFAEMDSLSRQDYRALKAFCSRAVDRQRDPFDRAVRDFPRRCVFGATLNEGGYIKDQTGGRRYWPLEVGEPIDLDQLRADRDQLWAEASFMEEFGVSEVLDRSLWKIAAERQSEQTSDDPWADTLRQFLHERAKPQPARDDMEFDGVAEPPPPKNRVHTSDLFDALDIAQKDRNKEKSQRLRTVMEHALKWRHLHSVRVQSRVGNGYIKT